MKYSISTFLYYYYSLEDAIKRIAAFGYDGVEIWGGTPHAYAYDLTEKQIKSLKALIEDVGLVISGFIPAQFRYPTNIAIDNEIIRIRSIDYLKKSIDVAVGLGSPLVSLCPGHSRFGQGYENAWENMIESINELLDYAGGDIKIMMEPGNRYETDLVVTADDAKKVLKDVNNKIGFVFDTGHMYINRESISDALYQFDKSMLHFHIDDNMGITDDHMVPGTGKINHDIFFKRLKESAYTGFITAELGFQYCKDPDPAAFETISYLKKKLS